MKYGIVIFPTKSLQDIANSYRKRYDPHYSLIPPHITLTSPFEKEDANIQELSQQIRQTVQDYNPFDIKIVKFSSFKPVNNVIYLKVEASNEIVKLHEAFNSLLSTQSEYNFVPHVTVGQKLSNDEFSDVYGSLRMQEINHSETVDRIHLLYQLENGSWTVYETFRLGKE